MRHNRRHCRRPCVHPRAFTLIELIVVAAIIVVLVAVSSPLFKTTFKDLEIKNTLYDLSKIIKYAQERSVIEEKRYQLVLNFDRNAYFLLSEKEDAKEKAGTDDSEEETDDSGWEKVPGRYGKVFYLPSGIRFRGELDRLKFYPGGRCDKASILVTDEKNESYEIRTNGRAGYVSIEKVETQDQ